ncbi:hypothetical protein EDB92DRAFT_1954899 [Lactarius akahatsu]|uniref:Peptidase S53 activation domain-containing protein n=1 Tax=Lactarius akahatsu TaxID=416441 RepID=A0AAD4LB10_9AGAM|nr:hypothetical protein EDB92DRAFT_1954899 [Lactarius akahatsu]
MLVVSVLRRRDIPPTTLGQYAREARVGYRPRNWEILGHSPAVATTDLHLALKSQREGALADALLELQNKTHLSEERAAEMVASHPDTFELANSWLKQQHGVPSSMISMTHGGSWLTVGAPRGGFHGSPYDWLRVPGGATRTLENHHLDDALRLGTYLVADVTQVHKRRSSGADVDVTPSYLRSLYKTMGYIPAAAGLNRLGIGGFLGQYPSPGDLRMNFTSMGPPRPATSSLSTEGTQHFSSSKAATR